MKPADYISLNLNGTSLEGPEILEFCNAQSEEHYTQLSQFLSQWLDDREDLEVKTSGSTGTPKAICIPKARMLQSAAATARFFGFQPGETALLSLPVSHIAGKMMVVRALYSHLNLKYIRPSHHPITELGTQDKINFAPFTPMQLSEANDTGNIDTILLGGGPVSPDLELKLQMWQAAIYHGFGMTETLSHIALRRVNGPDASGVYKALPGVELTVDERSCLVIRAPFVEGPVVTNDIVDLQGNDAFVWRGRIDHVINSGGIKLFPEEIEKKLNTCIDRDYFIAGIPDPIFGEKICLFIEGEAWSYEQQDKLSNIMDQCLTKYERPKKLYFVLNFSRTLSGKIQRKTTIEYVLQNR